MKYLIRHITFVFIFLLYLAIGHAQNGYVDSLKNEIRSQKSDTGEVKLLINLSYVYAFSYADTGLIYAQQALNLAEKLNFDQGVFDAMCTLNSCLLTLGNYPLLLDYSLKALSLANKMKKPSQIAMATGILAECYYNLGEYNISLRYDREVLKIMDGFFNDKVYFMWIQLSRSFQGLHLYDSGLIYVRKAYEDIKKNPTPNDISLIAPILGNAYAGKTYYDSALFYYKMGIPIASQYNFATDLVDNYNGIATVYKEKGNLDSAIWYSKRILTAKISKSYPLGLLKAANMLSDIYQNKKQADSVLKFMRIAIILKDSLFNREKMNAVQSIIYKNQERQNELVSMSRDLQNRLKMYAVSGGILIFIIVSYLLLRNQRLRQLQNIRTRIADDLHDDIGATLTNISVLSELSKRELNLNNPANIFLSRISEEVNTTSQALDDIIWMVNVRNDSVEEIMLRMRRYTGELFDSSDKKYTLIFDEALKDIKLSMHQRHDLYLIFKEALNNIYRHANASLVTVELIKKDRFIVMHIKDNGKGFEIMPTHRNGLRNMQYRAQKNRGNLQVESRLSKGTSINLSFPF